MFAQRGFAQSGNTFDPNVVLSSHVDVLSPRWRNLCLSVASYVPLPVPPTLLVAWAAGYVATSPLGTLLTTDVQVIPFSRPSLYFSRSGHAGISTFVGEGKKKEGGAME